jgi:hypothetical protein
MFVSAAFILNSIPKLRRLKGLLGLTLHENKSYSRKLRALLMARNITFTLLIIIVMDDAESGKAFRRHKPHTTKQSPLHITAENSKDIEEDMATTEAMYAGRRAVKAGAGDEATGPAVDP